MYQECKKLIQTALECGILHGENGMVLVYRAEGEKSPEGWYLESVDSVAKELISDNEGRMIIKKAIERKQVG